VIVADPNCALMYGHRSRRVKTDRRDAAALAEACRHRIYRPAHRRSTRQRTVQWHLNIRRELVAARTRAISLARAITPGAGFRIPGGATETFRTRLAGLDLPAAMRESLAPLDRLMEVLDEELDRADTHFAALVADDPIVQRLTTCPSIGPITATALVAALDDVHRFDGPRSAAQVASYLGLVPREYSSGEQQQRGRVMRIAHPYLQALLVQAAWRVCRCTDPRTSALRKRAQAIAARRGKNIAIVTLAKRLARILCAMWRDEVEYQPTRTRPGRDEAAGDTSQPAA
jgi:transposase